MIDFSEADAGRQEAGEAGPLFPGSAGGRREAGASQDLLPEPVAKATNFASHTRAAPMAGSNRVSPVPSAHS